MPRTLLTLITAVLISACGHNVQTSSGQEYLAKYPAPSASDRSPGAIDTQMVDSLEQQVRAAAAIEPTLEFPVRLGLARIQEGRLSAIPSTEAKAWRALADKLGSAFGEFVPVSLLVAVLASSSVGLPFTADASKFVVPQLEHTIAKIRIGAARQHLDLVLVYEAVGSSRASSNLLGVLDFTIIGAFVLPSNDVEASGHAQALLLDVRNGYPYATASATARESSLSNSWDSDDTRQRLEQRTAATAALKLVPEVEAAILKLLAQTSANRS